MYNIAESYAKIQLYNHKNAHKNTFREDILTKNIFFITFAIFYIIYTTKYYFLSQKYLLRLFLIIIKQI